MCVRSIHEHVVVAILKYAAVHLDMLRICRQASVTGPIYLPALLIGMRCTVGGKWLTNVYNSFEIVHTVHISAKTKTSTGGVSYLVSIYCCVVFIYVHILDHGTHDLTHWKMCLAPLYIAFQPIVLEGMWIYMKIHHTDLPADTQHVTGCTAAYLRIATTSCSWIERNAHIWYAVMFRVPLHHTSEQPTHKSAKVLLKIQSHSLKG